jgi:hypothetical protein
MTRSLWATLCGGLESIVVFHPAAPLVAATMVFHATILLVSLVRPGVYEAPRVRSALRFSRWLAFVAVVVVGLLRGLLVAGGVLNWDTLRGLSW